MSRRQLWRVLVNSVDEFDKGIADALVRYLIGNIADHSLLEDEKIGVGLRDSLVYSLLKLVDAIGWIDEGRRRRENTDQNVAEIAEWIFGENKHSAHGIVEKLGSRDRGPLGLYDLLIFRLYCSADRAGSLFNLQKALSKHDSPDAPTSGDTVTIAIQGMREISQRVFALFKSQYIDARINILMEIDGLALKDVTGKYFQFVQDQLESGVVSEGELDKSLLTLKSRLKAFITYQLGNNKVSSGVGCGFYDIEGRGKLGGIHSAMNDYLFGTCFVPGGDEAEFECFLDYLLINFEQVYFGDGDSFLPTIGEFTKVLEKEQLAEYWIRNSESIRAKNYQRLEKKVVTGNYSASYQEYIEKVYEVLDNVTSEILEKRNAGVQELGA